MTLETPLSYYSSEIKIQNSTVWLLVHKDMWEEGPTGENGYETDNLTPL